MANCFKSKTYCSTKTKNHTCDREITEEELKEAKEKEIPICWGEFCEEDY